eukprot:TRINITY_DN1770_c2_g1_i1.p2 TRINITY_DN1770_c2_g1~~TRINITY_DN1770_c2_g1_i1.p2  ORF type:complete len:227 (-),score=-13.88 TRINITY_DN1770_c2_g1_i1:602-1282(-)
MHAFVCSIGFCTLSRMLVLEDFFQLALRFKVFITRKPISCTQYIITKYIQLQILYLIHIVKREVKSIVFYSILLYYFSVQICNNIQKTFVINEDTCINRYKAFVLKYISNLNLFSSICWSCFIHIGANHMTTDVDILWILYHMYNILAFAALHFQKNFLHGFILSCGYNFNRCADYHDILVGMLYNYCFKLVVVLLNQANIFLNIQLQLKNMCNVLLWFACAQVTI